MCGRSLFLFCRLYSSASTPKGRLVDRIRVYARGGSGGNAKPREGCVGGDGGDVSVCASEGCSLADVGRSAHRKGRRFVAPMGGNGGRGKLFGDRGDDIIIHVPPGTVVYDESGNQVCDLDCAGASRVLTRGGVGGTLAADQTSGRRGVAALYSLELKLIADVGLVGFPNAGKSTLLSALSNASPKIASYPFTTVRPQLGLMRSHDLSEPITVADLPGLVEGAHSNVGLGHRFLRHIERTNLLLYVVDITGFQLSLKHPFRDAISTVELLTQELQWYDAELLRKPSILAVNKLDLVAERERKEVLAGFVSALDQCRTRPPFSHVLGVSGLTGGQLTALKSAIREVMKGIRP